MPQETKAMPFDPDSLDHAPGFAHENLEGSAPSMTTDDEIRAAVEHAFDYRGDVTVTLKDGRIAVGYIFDRRLGQALADCTFRLIPSDSDGKLTIAYSQLAALAFTGRDTAAGKSFETWVKKYREKKTAGEKNIRLEPEKLD
ncbi:MAG TPA: hypothetical protein VL992_02205 [Tepidisphaeraceae bacterium]|nr:hypothetical protein [Tepidisphaeraceae bacterium]